MSTTIYESPEYRPPDKSNGRKPQGLSVDITYEYVWFFQHDCWDGKDEMKPVMMHLRELPALHEAIGQYLAQTGENVENP